MLGFGVFGYFMQKYDFPLSPILLALILGPMAEANLRRSLVVSGGDFGIILTRPIAVALLVLAVGRITSYNVCYTKLLRDCCLNGAAAQLFAKGDLDPDP